MTTSKPPVAQGGGGIDQRVLSMGLQISLGADAAEAQSDQAMALTNTFSRTSLDLLAINAIMSHLASGPWTKPEKIGFLASLKQSESSATARGSTRRTQSCACIENYFVADDYEAADADELSRKLATRTWRWGFTCPDQVLLKRLSAIVQTLRLQGSKNTCWRETENSEGHKRMHQGN